MQLSKNDMIIVNRALGIALHDNAKKRKRAAANRSNTLSSLAMEGADYSLLQDRVIDALKELKD